MNLADTPRTDPAPDVVGQPQPAPDLLDGLQPLQVVEPALVDPSLQHDVHCVLIQCHRDRGAQQALRQDIKAPELEAFARRLATLLGPRIGGRYVPKHSRAATAARDEAVWQAWQRTRDYRQVGRQFGISRRLLFSILARKRR